jgi:hypothetical protein
MASDMTDAPTATEGMRHVRTERHGRNNLRYCRMTCPAGVSMTSLVTLVPMPHVRSYFADEIASEGRWRSGVPIIVILPSGNADKPAPADWFPGIYAQMRQARRGEAPPLYRLRNGSRIDIGIIDIQIELHCRDEGMIPHLIESGTFAHENMAFLDHITGRRIHNAMVFAAAFHRHHSTGKPHYHFHNLIFGLRQEPGEGGGAQRIGMIDLIPLIDALNERHDQNVVAGRKAG